MADLSAALVALEHIRALATRAPKTEAQATAILQQIVAHARAAHRDPAMDLVATISRFTRPGRDPDDDRDTIASLIHRARIITKGA